MKTKMMLTQLFVSMFALTALAQPPGGPEGGRGRGPGGPGGPGGGANVEESVKRLMAFDKNNDGSLTEEELADSRLLPLLQRADANKDKVVTKEELVALLTKESQSAQGEGRGGPEGRGEGRGGPEGGRGFGPDGGRGRGGMGMMRPGQILPDFMRERLQLSEVQTAALAKLQATVDAEMAKILTAEQQQQLKQGPGDQDRGPGGPGGFGGPGGPGAGRPPRPEPKN